MLVAGPAVSVAARCGGRAEKAVYKCRNNHGDNSSCSFLTAKVECFHRGVFVSFDSWNGGGRAAGRSATLALQSH